jgi:hypothetical protein
MLPVVTAETAKGAGGGRIEATIQTTHDHRADEADVDQFIRRRTATRPRPATPRSIASRTTRIATTTAATGSARHQPSTAFATSPTRVVAESHRQVVVWKASVIRARDPSARPVVRFARARNPITPSERRDDDADRAGVRTVGVQDHAASTRT